MRDRQAQLHSRRSDLDASAALTSASSARQTRVQRKYSGGTIAAEPVVQRRQAQPSTRMSEQSANEMMGDAILPLSVQQKSTSDEGESKQSVHAAAARGTQGPGTELPHLDAIQRSFGHHDVSGVKAHIGGRAGEACDSMGADAYASGADVAFKSSPSLHTVAHEAAHVVQQRGGVQLKGGVGVPGDGYEAGADRVADLVVAGRSAQAELDAQTGSSQARSSRSVQRQPVVQRKTRRTVRRHSRGSTVKVLQQRLNAKQVVDPPLKIDGIFGPLTQAAVETYQANHKDAEGVQLKVDGIVGPKTWGAISGGHAKTELANTQSAIGDHITDEMNRTNRPTGAHDQGVWYDFNYKSSFPDKWNDDYTRGYADPQYFTRIGTWDWRLKPRMSASAGIKAWLRGLTIAECNSAIVAQQTDAVRAAIGDKKFDERFGSTDKAVPKSQRMRIKQGTSGTVVDGMNVLTDEAQKQDPGSENARPVKKGDWCYFYNHPQYLLKHPGGAYQGENALYMGTDADGNQRWSGMGVDNKLEKDLLTAMASDYNRPRDEWDNEELARIKKDNGGTLPEKYELDGGVFPETLTDISQILTAPEYTLDGTTRKGGFVARSPRHLDTKKIDALK